MADPLRPGNDCWSAPCSSFLGGVEASKKKESKPPCSPCLRGEATAGSARIEQLGGFRCLHEVERAGNVVPQFATMHHGVQHSVLQEELAALEAFGQLLADGLFNYARPGKTNQ